MQDILNITRIKDTMMSKSHHVRVLRSSLLQTTFIIFLLSKAVHVSCSGGEANVDLFAWARQHGATISDKIEIRTTTYGGRGLFAKCDIPADTVLITIPYELQLGVRQLAEGTDEEMQSMARALPWQYILQNELFFIPLSIALCAEQRKGTSSIFEPFIRDLPTLLTHALATSEDDLSDLEAWAPSVAKKVLDRRNGILSLHQQLAPPSLSLEELRWAVTNVCSRSLVRKRIRELNADQVQLIGEFASSDRSRMLPVIDLVNHGSLHQANVWVGHISQDESSNVNDFSTSLKSTRGIDADEELLFDYGGGGGTKISNERLLLDYGFVLPEHTDRVTISMEEFVKAITDLHRNRPGMVEVSEEDMVGLNALIKFLINHATQVQEGAPLVFDCKGRPSVQSLAVAVVMTCQGQDDVTRVLRPVLQKPESASVLPAQVLESCTEIHEEVARNALRNAVTMALVQRPVVSDDAGMTNDRQFINVAREFSAMVREVFQIAAGSSTI